MYINSCMILYYLIFLFFFILLAAANSVYIIGLHSALDYQNLKIELKYKAYLPDGALRIVLNGVVRNIITDETDSIVVHTTDYPKLKISRLNGSNGYVKVFSLKETVDKNHAGLLYLIKQWCQKEFGEWWAKPFVSCVSCMSSVHCSYVFAAVLYALQSDLIWYAAYIPYALLTAGISYLIYR